MNMKFLLKSLGLLLLASPLIHAESDECKNLRSTLGNVSENEVECFTNENGKINKLYVSNTKLTKEQVDKLFSYDLENVVDLTYIIDVGYSSSSSPLEHPGYSEFPTAINKLKSLETLILSYSNLIHPCSGDCLSQYLTTIQKDTLKNLENLKTLTIEGVIFSQDNIDEISKMKNLETLYLYTTYLSDTINYSSIGDLEKLTTLNVYHVSGSYENVDDYKKLIPNSFITSNKNIKNLTIALFSDDKVVLENVPKLEKLNIYADFMPNVEIKENLEKLNELHLQFLSQGGEYATKQINLKFNFSKMENLKSLYLAGYILSEENMKTITSYNLDSLSLVNCILTNVTLEGINKMSDLSTLVFDYSEIEEEKFDALKNLNNITSLSLKRININKIPDFVSSLTNLQSLDIENNNLSGEIPEYLNSFPQLKEIKFASNNFEGKTLTNPSLKHCDYFRNTLLCLAKEMECTKGQDIKPCSNNDEPITRTITETIKPTIPSELEDTEDPLDYEQVVVDTDDENDDENDNGSSSEETYDDNDDDDDDDDNEDDEGNDTDEESDDDDDNEDDEDSDTDEESDDDDDDDDGRTFKHHNQHNNKHGGKKYHGGMKKNNKQTYHKQHTKKEKN